MQTPNAVLKLFLNVKKLFAFKKKSKNICHILLIIIKLYTSFKSNVSEIFMNSRMAKKYSLSMLMNA